MANASEPSSFNDDLKKLLEQEVQHQHRFCENLHGLWQRKKLDKRKSGQEQSVQDLLEEKKKADAVAAPMLEDLCQADQVPLRDKDPQGQRDSGYIPSPAALSPANSDDMDLAKRRGCYIAPSDACLPRGLPELISRQDSLPSDLHAIPGEREATEQSHDFEKSEVTKPE